MEKMTRNYFAISTIKEFATKNNEDILKNYIDIIDFSDSEKKSLYAKCVMDLKELNKDINNYSEEVIKICDYYLDIEDGYIFNKVKYDNNFRKSKSKQLNVDIDIDLMEKFEYYLSQNKETKKNVIKNAVINYIEESQKKEKK